MTAEVAFRFDISLIDATPGCAKQEIRDVSGIQLLPLGDFSGRFILFRAADQGWAVSGKLPEHLLFQNRTYIGGTGKIRLATGEAALAAHVDEIREWLSSSCPFVKIRPLSAECIRRDYTLGLELVVTHGTTKLDLTQRCHCRLLLFAR
jgi:hypothetical protein